MSPYYEVKRAEISVNHGRSQEHVVSCRPLQNGNHTINHGDVKAQVVINGSKATVLLSKITGDLTRGWVGDSQEEETFADRGSRRSVEYDKGTPLYIMGRDSEPSLAIEWHQSRKAPKVTHPIR